MPYIVGGSCEDPVMSEMALTRQQASEAVTGHGWRLVLDNFCCQC